VGKPDRKRLLGRPRHRWKDKIKTNFKEIGKGALTGLIGSEQGQAMGCCECGDEPLGSIKCREFLD